MKKFLKLLPIIFLISECTMAPTYKTPEPDVAFENPSNPSKKKITQISWKEFFTSPDLQRVIQLSLENNKDLKVANLKIEAARAAHAVARANLMPTINATASETKQGVPSAFASFTPRKQFRANLSISAFEVDFFGRLQSLKKAALESFLASEEAKNVMTISIIAETVNAYAQVLVDQEVLKIAQENLNAQADRNKFTKARYENGIDSETTLLNSVTLFETANANYETYKKVFQQDRNALMALVGKFDEQSLPKDASINDIKINEDLIDFAQSEILLERPDIKQAEHQLKSANANIGAARAAFFPSITLTGSYGYGSRELNTLFDSKTWVFTPQINLPIFTGGRNIANLKNANIQKKIEIIQYQQAIQTAFREALDELAQRESASNQLQSFNEILHAREKNYIASDVKHSVGLSSGFDVADAKITLLTAKQNQLNMKKEYIVNLVNLYKVFGGGSAVVEEKFAQK